MKTKSKIILGLLGSVSLVVTPVSIALTATSCGSSSGSDSSESPQQPTEPVKKPNSSDNPVEPDDGSLDTKFLASGMNDVFLQNDFLTNHLTADTLLKSINNPETISTLKKAIYDNSDTIFRNTPEGFLPSLANATLTVERANKNDLKFTLTDIKKLNSSGKVINGSKLSTFVHCKLITSVNEQTYTSILNSFNINRLRPQQVISFLQQNEEQFRFKLVQEFDNLFYLAPPELAKAIKDGTAKFDYSVGKIGHTNYVIVKMSNAPWNTDIEDNVIGENDELSISPRQYYDYPSDFRYGTGLSTYLDTFLTERPVEQYTQQQAIDIFNKHIPEIKEQLKTNYDTWLGKDQCPTEFPASLDGSTITFEPLDKDKINIVLSNVTLFGQGGLVATNQTGKHTLGRYYERNTKINNAKFDEFLSTFVPNFENLNRFQVQYYIQDNEDRFRQEIIKPESGVFVDVPDNFANKLLDKTATPIYFSTGGTMTSYGMTVSFTNLDVYKANEIVSNTITGTYESPTKNETEIVQSEFDKMFAQWVPDFSTITAWEAYDILLPHLDEMKQYIVANADKCFTNIPRNFVETLKTNGRLKLELWEDSGHDCNSRLEITGIDKFFDYRIDEGSFVYVSTPASKVTTTILKDKLAEVCMSYFPTPATVAVDQAISTLNTNNKKIMEQIHNNLGTYFTNYPQYFNDVFDPKYHELTFEKIDEHTIKVISPWLRVYDNGQISPKEIKIDWQLTGFNNPTPAPEPAPALAPDPTA